MSGYVGTLNLRFLILPIARNIPIGRWGTGPALQALLTAGSVLVNPSIQRYGLNVYVCIRQILD